LTIVGVVADAKYQRLQETNRSIAYLPHRQLRDYASGASAFASIRVRVVTERAVTRIREAVLGVDPRAVARVERFSDRVRESLVTERLLATLAAAVAGCAFFLACAGLCGLMFQLVARRTREIGVRLALGARATDVRRQVVGQAVAITACGLAVGTTMALGFADWIRSVLHGITPNDPATYIIVAMGTLTLAGIVSLLPAHRAATIDPMEALRME
jgi:ABC-type lipoprotein release transport system permease subunit